MQPLVSLSIAFSFLSVVACSAVEGLEENVVAHWSFDQSFSDKSGHGHNGTPEGTRFVADRFHGPSAACWFNGISDYIRVTPSTSLQLRNEISVLSWVNCSGGGPWNPRIISYGGNFPSPFNGFELLTVGNGPERQVMFFFGNQSIVSARRIREGSWHFVSAVGTLKHLAIYIDGEIDVSKTIESPTFFYGDSEMGIGRKAPAGMSLQDDLWGGAIDELRVLNRALSPMEILQYYQRETLPMLTIAVEEIKTLRLGLVNLVIGADYQLQSSPDLLDWIKVGSAFTATRTAESQQIDSSAGMGFWRLQKIQ